MAQLKPVAKKQVKAVENPVKNRNFKPPNLDEFLPKEKKTMVSYMEGAKYYSMNYYAFVKLAKEAGANIRIKKKVVVDLQLVDEYLEKTVKEMEKMAYKRKTTENTAELLKSGKKKWVRYDEGAELYSIGYHSFIRLAKEAGAVYHINRIVLVNTEKLDEYMEMFCDDPRDF